MSSVVAVVAARPETLADDYRRVLDLAGLKAADVPEGVRTVLRESDAPGSGSPPWHHDLVCRALDRAPADLPREVVAGRRGGRRDVPVRAPLVLLPVPRLVAGWGVENAVALLLAAAGQPVVDPRRRPDHMAAFLAAQTAPAAVVCDAILWGARCGTPGRTFIVRNILLAGRDPLAVDAVSLRLAGMDPGAYRWLEVLEEAGVGCARSEGIRITGDRELLDHPFAGADWAGPPGGGRTGDLVWRLLRRRALQRRFVRTAWGALAASGTDQGGI